MDHPTRATIVYDADCGFCQWSLSRILAWDRHHLLRPVALQSDEADRLLDGMADDDRAASWHLVAPDGRTWSAGAAVPPLLRILPGGRPLATVASFLPRTTERLYRWVAAHRHRLSRMPRSRTRCGIPRVGLDRPMSQRAQRRLRD